MAGGNGKVGAVGFCHDGGGVVNMLATRLPDLAAIKAPLLIVFVDTDERINAMRPLCEAMLKAANVKREAGKYLGTQRGFNSDATPRHAMTPPPRRRERTLAPFDRRLRG